MTCTQTTSMAMFGFLIIAPEERIGMRMPDSEIIKKKSITKHKIITSCQMWTRLNTESYILLRFTFSKQKSLKKIAICKTS